MKYVDEFRDRKLVVKLADEIRRAAGGGIYNIMEVCGTHTLNIFRFGLRGLLPRNIRLISGPGCPVCVTPNRFIDTAIAIAKLKGVIITTFGDMFKVPGSYSSLEKERSSGRSIKIVYSPMDALRMAEDNPDREVVFLGVGFETTAPTVAQSVFCAEKTGIKNYSVLCGHKTMPAILEALVADKRLKVDGFLLPGHVSAIIGEGPYGFLSRRYGKRCVIAGFEPLDILEAILMILRQRRPAVEIQYTRITERGGNALARKVINKVFESSSSVWRGIGEVEGSGLKIRGSFADFDAGKRFKVNPGKARENKSCICKDVLKGLKTPLDCRIFGKSCTPSNPVGACMVSSEGTCAAYYRYGAAR
jgi:hydrogenase expression/formation protein HypD